jgi:double-stranded uracil-DNA glycosylase
MFSVYENDHSLVKCRDVRVLRMSASTDGERPPLGDLIAPGLRVLIVAINPSTRSAGIGYSFSSPSNPFWRLLHESGLMPVQLQPCEEHRLLDHGIGLVSTVLRATPAAAELTSAERRAGAARVRGLVERHEPQAVALLGLTLYPLFFASGDSPGPGLKPDRLHHAEVYVLPNPSGRNRAYPGFEPKLVWFRALADHLQRGTDRRVALERSPKFSG